MTVVAIFVVLGLAVGSMGWWGRRNASSLGAVPGMPAEHVEHRTAVLRRGATVCFVVGACMVVVGVAAPFL
ncbi:hypothetical protein LWC33_15515 [Pseudonocardia sp. RS11V-5]|uniref:hypothetical protein n=1 Tax=Pseudonocardia terrae TaxID=2905831 RepID=UPI001E3D9A1B|nr:hypothetical protein [Pseudonocardia terrae]MCE3552860.1 hypothetical protein [Pseudonocardia terrae]